MAELLDATYSSVADRIQMVLAPTISLEARIALLQVVDAVQAGKISLQEAQQWAEAIKPGMGGLFDIATGLTRQLSLAQ